MKSVDVAVIGGGILGCFAARNLMRWNLSVVLIEKELDICTGITRQTLPSSMRDMTIKPVPGRRN